MSLKHHPLYKATQSNLERWISPDELQLTSLRQRIEDSSLSPIERYEVGSFFWCKTLTQVLTRMKSIREMTNRSIHKKKGEDTSKIIRDWMSYNYQLYSITYQSILEVALLTTNEILDLGYSDWQCNYRTICDNRRVKAANILGPLKELQKITLKHREGKNLLVHQGKKIPLPTKTKKITSLDLSAIAEELGRDESEIKAILAEFLTKKSREKLLAKMESECRAIELKVKGLFDSLLPQYTRVHSFYEQ